MRRLPRIPVPSTRTLTIVWSAVIAALLVGVIALTVFVLDLSQSREVGREDRADLRQQLVLTQDDLAEQQAAAEALAEQVEGLGEEPVVRPGSSSPLLPLLPRVVTPARATVIDSVRLLLDDALLRVCGGDCNGEDGEPLPPLPPADPLPPLPPLPPIPGQKGDTGNTGAAGPAGPIGPAGRGVVRFDCVAGEDVVLYTDDTTQTVPGLTCIPQPPTTPEE